MMIKSLVEGFLLGAGASMPIGPINILIINEALKSYKNAVSIGVGAMSADLTYLLLIFFGIASQIEKSHLIFQIITTFGAAFLFYLSYNIFKNRNIPYLKDIKTVHTSTVKKSYFKGYFSTLFNPYTIIFWFSMSTYIIARHLNPSITIIGVMSAISLWITAMPLLIYKTKNILNQKASVIINIISSIIIFGFALSIFFEMVFG